MIVAGGAALWTSCDLGDESEDGLDKSFLRDVAAVEEMGLPVYWLGTEFPADGLVFRGPYGAEFGNELEGGINMHYLAPIDGGNAAFDLTVYGRDAWGAAAGRVLNPGVPGVIRKTVTVLGRDAEAVSVPLGARPVNILWLVLDMGDVIVVGTARSGAPDEPENPLIDPDNLIAVMEDLRPYPE